ncbi:MAG: hypothetical protein R3B72_36730 [Polyangiaceae bacterium]
MARGVAEVMADYRLDAELWCEGRSPWLRASLTGYLVYAGLRHLADPAYRSWFAGITLGFHELGHLVFAGLGHTMMLLGGSLLQLLAPAAAGLYLLLRQGDHFGAAVGGSWFAFASWELATYVYDAPREELPLVGFGDHPQHDWGTLLTEWGVLNAADNYAAVIRGVATLSWLTSVALATWLCVVMWRLGRAARA